MTRIAYETLERAAGQVQLNGGFAMVNDTFEVPLDDGKLVIKGEDRIEFALILKRRAESLQVDGLDEARRQGYEAAKRELSSQIKKILGP